MMKDEMADKTVLVTGASSGIGRATALRFAEVKANLILIGRDQNALNSVAIETSKIGGEVVVHSLDLINSEATLEFFSELGELDIAINNAGTEGQIGDITQLELNHYDQAMNLNLRSVWLCMREEIKFFRKNKQKGNIVNVSSTAGLFGIPNSSLYVASKHAINGLTKSVALEQIKHGIRINAVCPGGVDTPMLNRVLSDDLSAAAGAHPIGRVAEPHEIANVIFWLASDQSEFVVGHCLVADGGLTLS